MAVIRLRWKGVDFDDLPPGGKATRARELVAFCVRHGRVADLITLGRKVLRTFPGRDCGDIEGRLIARELVEAVRKAYVLDWDGMHGVNHWLRVRENGLRLAELTGADRQVVELFAFLHDVKRVTDWPDPEHGRRAAEFAETLRGSLIVLPDRAFRWLAYACERHSDGLTKAPPTVQTCWDADRLDLGRIGVKPDPRFLCTAAAKDAAMIEWAFLRSQKKPDNVTWLLQKRDADRADERR